MAKGDADLTFFINSAMTATIIGVAAGIGIDFLMNFAVAGFARLAEIPESEAIVLFGRTMSLYNLLYKIGIFGGVGLFIGLGYAFTMAAKTKKPKNIEKDIEEKIKQLAAEEKAQETSSSDSTEKDPS